MLSILCLAETGIFASAQKADRESELQRHYDAAQHFQQTGDLEQAAREYKKFIADALGELATGKAHNGDYGQAKKEFDDAVALTPDSNSLLMQYARAALASQDYEQAQGLANRMLTDAGAQQNEATVAAEAHQISGRALLKMNRDADARKELETAVALNPNFENGYALAVVCLDMDDDKCAGRVFSEIERSFGDTATIHMQFGLAYGESDFTQLAIAEFKKAIAENPRLPESHYSLAAAYLASAQTSSLENAETELEKELAVSPNDFLTYAALGHIAVIQHRYEAAEKYLKHAIALNGNNPDAYLYLGQMYFETNRPTEAETALRAAIAKTTDVSRNRYQIQKAHYLLGRLLAKSGNEAEARSEMQTVQELMKQTLSQDEARMSGSNGQNGTTESNANTIAAAEVKDENKRDADTADVREVRAFEKRIAAPIADSYNNLGATAASTKDYATALTYFQHAAEWNPNLDGLDYNWGHAAFMASRFADAVPPLTRYLDAHKQDSNIRSVLGISLFMTGKYGEVVKTLQPMRGNINAVPQVEYAYAASLVKTGQRDAGMQLLTAMEQKNPDIADVHRSLGEGYADEGTAEQQKAVQELETAIKLNPRDAQAHCDLGKLDLQSGEVRGAIAELETAVQLQPENREAHADLADAYERGSRPADAERERKLFKRQASSQVNKP